MDIKYDEEQMRVINSKSKYLLVIAGAGCGKTTTIVGKIKKLLEDGYKHNEILLLSFTNFSVSDMKLKLKNQGIFEVDVYTFHKLSLNILNKAGYNYEITSDFLKFIIDEYFESLIFDDVNAMYALLKYYNNFVVKIDILKKYRNFILNNDISKLKLNILSYIKVLKANGYTLKDFNKFYNNKFKTKDYYFIKLVLSIYQLYEYELVSNSLIDFDDMIIKATEVVQNICLDYKVIIIDEYQDTSPIRFELIKKIIEKNDTSFVAVGDDFQSIYRFAGCDLNIMLDFKKCFPTGEVLYITKTYRNSKQLLDIAGKFIMKNPYQIKKSLKSDKSLFLPIKFIYYTNPRKAFQGIVDKLGKDILILGRNNRDIYRYCNSISSLKSDIRYMTVHKSKGLEAENVILINLSNDILGFPSKMIASKIFNKILPTPDRYRYSEERRLFYVALTRTKSYVYILVPKYNKSVFIKELEKIVKSSKVK